ncbi:MAG: beta-lactamase family protein [bacterium]|nr:beta-lactamase family protein [bacterium]
MTQRSSCKVNPMIGLALAGLLSWLGLGTVSAQEGDAAADAAAPEEAAAATSPPAHRLTDPEELEAFLDGMMAAHMRSRDIASATLSVVKDGSLFFAKGYGYADREQRIPVEADKTLFRPGSISKLFTWTAVMQLVERGELDLAADVNDYLADFKVPATYPEPITMKHLLTHTPGFEDGGLGYLFIRSADKIVPLAESLAAHIPARVRPPGTYSSYSNFGTALAGLIVANISGMPFQEYVEKNIFEPLGMDHSTFREPLPEALAPDMAVGYQREAGLYEARDFEFISNFGPAGALSSTATDMARFMIAHLRLGRYGDARILEEATARRMQSQLYTLDPRLPGMAHGFCETEINRLRVIGHGGDTFYFHSLLVLLPEHDVGLYVSYVAAGSLVRFELLEAFVERYFPVPEEPELIPPADFTERADRFAGTYRFTRHNYSTIEKLFALVATISVTPTEAGTLMVDGFLGQTMHWVEVEPLLFRQIDGWQSLAFKEDENGEITHLAFSVYPFMPAYRAAWYTVPAFNFTLLGLGVLLFITTLVSAFRHREKTREAPPIERWPIRLAVAVSALTLLLLVSVVAIVAAEGVDIFYGVPATMTVALVLPILTSLLTVGIAVFVPMAWRGRYWTAGRRVHYTLFAVLAVGYVWFYYYWNVLGFQY